MEKDHSNPVKNAVPEGETHSGATLSPPAFQLKTSGQPIQRQPNPQTPGTIRYLRDILSLHPLPSGVTVRSHVQQWQIMNTEEFRSLMDPTLVWQRDYQLSYEQAMDTCYEILARLAAGGHVDWQAEARRFVRNSIRLESQEEGRVASPANQALISAGLQTVITNFRNAVAAATTVQAIEAAVNTHAPLLWTTGRTETQNLPLSALGQSDRSMYWARLEMRRILRNNAILRQDANLGKLQTFITALEDQSRGSRDITAFGSNSDPRKRILITGFDPFGGGTSNPSGIVAQRLDGQPVRYGTGEVGVMEALTFPVRYDDFDHGMVERLVGPIINNAENNVTLVVTISLDNNATTLNLDRFAAHTRFGHRENGDIANPLAMPPQFNRDGSVKTSSIPTTATVPQLQTIADQVRAFLLEHYSRIGTVPTIPTIGNRTDLMNWLQGPVRAFLAQVARNHFSPQGDNGAEFIPSNMNLSGMIADPNMPANARVNQGFTSMDATGQQHNQTGPRLATTAAQVNGASTPDPSHAAVSGSGGDYLSNEIYHRVSTLRTQSGRSIRNVHIHIPSEGNNIEGETGQYDAARITADVQRIIGVAVNQN